MQKSTNLCAQCATCDFASKRVWESQSNEVVELAGSILDEIQQRELGNMREHRDYKSNIILILS